jgi:hypothetical protein
VAIDLNYIGAADRVTMLAENPLVEQAITQVEWDSPCRSHEDRVSRALS